MMQHSHRRLYAGAIFLALFSIFISLTKGSTSTSIYQLLFANDEQSRLIFFQLRLPRTLTAFVSGGLLALAGALMQLLVQNPLADPYVLGVSGGAAFFTLLMMLLGVNEYGLLGGAWAGSLSTMLCLMFLARHHHWQTHKLLLSGVAIACGLSAMISCLLLLAPDADLRSMLFWLAGDLNQVSLPWLGIIILSVCAIISWLLASGLNIFSRGELAARALGLPTQRYRISLYLLSSLCTATAVSLTGCIGFIGLIIPHMTRLLIGHDQRILLPITILLGGSLLTAADTLARTLFAPQQIPVGILLALIGVPIFVWLLQR